MTDDDSSEPDTDELTVERARRILTSGSADEATVADAFDYLTAHGDRSEKVVSVAELPPLRLDHRHLTSENTYPIVVEGATIGTIRAREATFDVPVVFRDCEIDHIDVTDAQFNHNVGFPGTTFGSFVGEETEFRQDADISGATFTGRVVMDEAMFGDDAAFTDVTFEDEALFRLATFNGESNELDDNADFSGTEFRGPVRFDRADFGSVTFAECTATERIQFHAATIRGESIFCRGRFAGPVVFEKATCEAPAVFDDATFTDEVCFDEATFREVSFSKAVFEADATFAAVHIEGAADFTDVAFGRDVSFESARFQTPAGRSGAVAAFPGTSFGGVADFSGISVGAIEFTDNEVGDTLSFSNARVRDRFDADFDLDDPLYLDFTGAKIRRAEIRQRTGKHLWVDFTSASIGDVFVGGADTAADPSVLDRVRFCDTEFDEFDGVQFDFSAYTAYFERRNWTLHTFEPPPGRDSFALPMTPDNIERTYLKAKNAATATGFDETAGEFRVKRQRWARKTHLEILTSGSEAVSSRIKSLSRVLENLFLDATCGYGVRLGRILFVFLIVPLTPALLFTFGGGLFATEAGQIALLRDIATVEGQRVLFDNIYFSYITFLTVGYGSIRPVGPLARLVAGVEVYLNVVLGGLVIYSLVKRSEL